MTKFLVCIRFYCAGSFIDQFYSVDERELFLLKNLKYNEEGSCCGTSRCFACKVGGFKCEYINKIKINDYNKDMAELVTQNTIYKLEKFIENNIDDVIWDLFGSDIKNLSTDEILLLFENYSNKIAANVKKEIKDYGEFNIDFFDE